MNKFMNIAIKEAKMAYTEGNVPVGAVIVHNGKVIAACHNTKNTTNIAINHAEILCIVQACKSLKSWYLDECDLYVTLSPCDMCIGAIAEARIRNVYYLLDSNYCANLNKQKNAICLSKLDDVYDYSEIIKSFFDKVRQV